MKKILFNVVVLFVLFSAVTAMGCGKVRHQDCPEPISYRSTEETVTECVQEINQIMYDTVKKGDITEKQAQAIVSTADLMASTICDDYNINGYLIYIDNNHMATCQVLEFDTKSGRYVNDGSRQEQKLDIIKEAIEEKIDPIGAIMTFSDPLCENDKYYAIVDADADGRWGKLIESPIDCFELYETTISNSPVVKIGKDDQVGYFGQFATNEEVKISNVAPKATINEIIHPGEDFSDKN